MNERSADRHLARRQRTHHIDDCHWCGELIMQSADTPGRRARFCSPRCRQAAYRAKKLSLARASPQFRTAN